jgi:hypothetical protein
MNCFLLVFFGIFGARKGSFTRLLFLWGVPLSVALQARPVKMWIKVLFYSMSNPPSIVLNLLAAPQKAIMSFDMEESYRALYGAALSSERNEGEKGASKLKDPTADEEDGDDNFDEFNEEDGDELNEEDEDEDEDEDEETDEDEEVES